jgi:hypothetical protein
LFLIIIQVSRFLKDFSDFETKYTPDFRHPAISGGPELEQIGLKEELRKLEMTFDEQLEKKALNEFEALNVDIPSNKEVVRNHYKQIIKEKMLKADPLNEDEEAEKLLKDLQKDEMQGSMDESEEDLDKIQESMIDTNRNSNFQKKKKDRDYLKGVPLQPEPEVNEQDPLYYYYKVTCFLI